jgi:flavin-binding protein dodecin
MATIEKVGIEIVGKLDKPSFQKAEDNVVQFARDTKKKLDPLLVQDLRLNLANLQM